MGPICFYRVENEREKERLGALRQIIRNSMRVVFYVLLPPYEFINYPPTFFLSFALYTRCSFLPALFAGMLGIFKKRKKKEGRNGKEIVRRYIRIS